jgi:four helix bundle protein
VISKNSNSEIKSFEDLIVWQKAIDLPVHVYKCTASFPKEEMFGLTSQIRRASNSVSLNISEGSVKSTRTFILQLKNALGSVNEVLSAGILATYLDFLPSSKLEEIRKNVVEITKMLNSLISSLEQKLKSGE